MCYTGMLNSLNDVFQSNEDYVDVVDLMGTEGEVVDGHAPSRQPQGTNMK